MAAKRSTACACSFDQTTTAPQGTLSRDGFTRAPCQPELFRAHLALRVLRPDLSTSGHLSLCSNSCASRQTRPIKPYEHAGLSKTAPLLAAHVTQTHPGCASHRTGNLPVRCVCSAVAAPNSNHASPKSQARPWMETYVHDAEGPNDGPNSANCVPLPLPPIPLAWHSLALSPLWDLSRPAAHGVHIADCVRRWPASLRPPAARCWPPICRNTSSDTIRRLSRSASAGNRRT